KLERETGSADRASQEAPGDKGVSVVRARLLRLLDASPYELDRLHLDVESTLDPSLQESTSRLLERLRDPGFLARNGLRGGDLLLDRGAPRRVVYSVLLLERTPQGDVVRVHADTLHGAFDLNDGMKLELGSTAKLRTLANYLEQVAGLHHELAGCGAAALRK